MSKIVIIIIVLLLLGAAGAYYYFYVMNKTPEEPTLAPTMGPTPPLDSFPYNIPGLSNPSGMIFLV
jgi:flagellar basal body-associated protein FliL